MTRSSLALLALLTLPALPAPVAAQAVDVSGEWVFDVSTSQGSGSPTFLFKQDGERLTGTYKGLLGQAELTGTVKEKAIRFSFTGTLQGTELTVTYEGSIEGTDSVKGTVDFGGMGTGTFTGRRKS
jgi:hypothetical protein